MSLIRSLFSLFNLYNRPLGGRHAAVIPALPDEHDGTTPGNGAPTNGDSANGHGYLNERGEPEPEPIPVPANPSAAAAATASTRSSNSRSRPMELTIIRMEDGPSLRPRNASQGQANPPMKSITFHQEYPNAPPENGPRTRRGSRASNAGYDEYANPPPQPPPPGGTPMHIDSPTHSRTASRSPVMHRGDRERDRERERDDRFSPPLHLPPPVVGHSRSQSTVASPHGHRSPYEPAGGPERVLSGAPEPAGYRAGTPPPPVPPRFASIMHAYPAPPIAASPSASEGASQDYAYVNGSGRRNGHPGER
ncbi:hypothetical protein BD414DRAFT_275236 [Trametes punicea]|nr:hypothetical protein BD414DRAFT_275236 [Trametes punicea]